MMKKSILFVTIALVFLAAAVSAIRAGERAFSSAPDVDEVKIDNFSFAPADISVRAGTTVRWINHDDIPHNVVSTDKLFKSEVLDTNEQFSHTFDKPGTYTYYCGLHPRMKATITVK
jgi:plastocyanin